MSVISVMSRLMKPQSVAIIGASADTTKTAGRPVSYLLKHGFKGQVYPVNPRVTEICGLPCFPDIASLPATPDVAIVLLGAQRAQQAVRELADRGCAAAIVLASGYSEVGEQGAALQKELIEAAGAMRILGPNTIGLVNITDSIVLSASGALEMDHFPAGNIGVVSQSGGILGSLLSRSAARGIGLSKLISTSNEVDLELSDFINWLVDDEATKVIALYVEAVRDIKKFRQAALRANHAGKPIVAFKIGRSQAGAQAAVSHTGALAGSDLMYDALFKQVGIIRANTFDGLLDIPAALASSRKLLGNRVAILTSTGGAGTLISDALGVSGFLTPAPDEVTARELRALQEGEHAALDRNPIDVTLAGLKPELLKSAIGSLLRSPTYDALVVIVGASGLAMPELMSNAINSCMDQSDKPVIAYISPHAPKIGSLLMQGGVPAYSSPESCSASLGAMLHASHWRAAESSKNASLIADPESVPSGVLDEAQAKLLFSSFGIASVAEVVVNNAEQAQAAVELLGSRVVLKILTSDIQHKSDIGGVAINISADMIAERMDRMVNEVQNNTGHVASRFLIQEMVTGGTELILGMHRDPLGTAILLGMGGVTAELFKDTSMRLLPDDGGLTREEALQMAMELKTWPLLNGYRGKPLADIEQLISAIVLFSEMVAALGERLLEAEINPLFVLERGKGVRAADGLAVLTQAVSH